MKFKGQIIIFENRDLLIKTRFGNFYLDSYSLNLPSYCVSTQNIMKAANYPSDEKFDIELIENNDGLLTFVRPELSTSGYHFGQRYIATFVKNQFKRLESVLPTIADEKTATFDLFINKILITKREK